MGSGSAASSVGANMGQIARMLVLRHLLDSGTIYSIKNRCLHPGQQQDAGRKSASFCTSRLQRQIKYVFTMNNLVQDKMLSGFTESL